VEAFKSSSQAIKRLQNTEVGEMPLDIGGFDGISTYLLLALV
jgi:hypothetical protein